MNISIAAHYLKIGYRIRRACWEPEEYLYELADMLERVEVHHSSSFNDKTAKFVEHRYVGHGGPALVFLQDLLADDWEIITTGIRKQFNKYGDFEYDDETDWDLYEPEDSSWGNEDEDE